jgi:actin cytoskeleton-regulatory complex protein SLA1
LPPFSSSIQADHTSVVKALYDYEANAPGELSVKEDELLLVFDTDDEWLLVQSQSEDGKAGFVPGNYVEVGICLSQASYFFIYTSSIGRQ